MSNKYKILFLKLSVIALIVIIGYWIMGAFNSLFEFYLLFIQMVFIPILVVYFYRYKKGLNTKTLNKVFRWFVWFFIITTAIVLIVGFFYDYPYYFEWWSIKEMLMFVIPTLIIVALLGVLLKLNSQLPPKQDRKELKIISTIRNNKEATIAIIAIILTLSFALFIWINTEIWINRIVGWSLDTGDYTELVPESTIDDYYNMALKKIAMSSSIILASAYLLIYSLKKK